MTRWLFILEIILLAGCARFHPQPLSPAQTAAELESRSLTNAVLKTYLESNLHRELTNWPAISWDFDRLTLAAFYYHPDLEVARAQWRVAQGGIQTAGGRRNPTLNLIPGYNTTTAVPSPWIPAVTLDVPIETAGKRGHRIAVAEHLSESARLNIATVAWQVRSRVRNRLIDYGAAWQRRTAFEERAGLIEQTANLLQQQANAGAISTAELIAPRAELAKSRSDLASAESQWAEARVTLAEAIGVPAAALKDIQIRAYQVERPMLINLTSAETRRAALQSRTDILGALENYAAQQAALQLEIAKQYPDIHLSPGYQYDQGDNKWTLGISIDLPVLNQNQGPIAEAKARCDEAAARFNALQAKVIGEIDGATALLEASQNNVKAAESFAQEQRKQLEVSAAQHAAGATDQLDLLRADIELRTAVLAECDARTKLWQAYGALEDAVQRPLTSPNAIFQSSRTYEH